MGRNKGRKIVKGGYNVGRGREYLWREQKRVRRRGVGAKILLALCIHRVSMIERARLHRA